MGSDVPVKFDDFNYLQTALTTQADPLAIFTETWFVHLRPGAHAVWWLLGPMDLAGNAVRAVQVLLWVLGTLLALRLADRHGAPGGGVWLMGLLLLGAMPFMELLDWKSWVTSLGTLVGFWAGLLAWKEGRLGWVVVAALGGLAFKETGTFALGWVLLLAGSGRERIVGGGLLSLAVLVGAAALDRVGGAHVLENLAFFYEKTPQSAAAFVPLMGALVWRSRPVAGAVVGAGAVIGTGMLSGAVVLVALAVWLRKRPLWVLAAVLCWTPSLFAGMRSMVYLLEGWLVLFVALVFTGLPQLDRRVWLVAALTGVWATSPFWLERASNRHQAQRQRVFLRHFDPEPARFLYRPRNRRPAVDELVYLERGTALGGPIPRGAEPVTIAPLSGSWADVTVGGQPWPQD